ncbi:nitroreductase [Mycolicibacterium pyrenivorans]|uniref:nitroreductase n=1 Tax=Mycolicibacterium pyrenivorans TaxID=187102 RepID=UPI0021F32FB9|nr:nitroreductase [Mycolicibacterium pyrenivorans]MCV7150446.1 nitroreductase [Mycolicibacterium pyrenivorans]
MPTNAIRHVKDAVRTFNKHVLNPAMMLLAGRRHWYASVIRHTGRRSGKTHATPVVADRVAGGFVIPLPYGTGVDWLRNSLASSSATLTVGGQTFEVVNPQILGATGAAAQLSPRRRRVYRRFGIDHFVRFDVANPSGE